jgi:hypothetical protein
MYCPNCSEVKADDAAQFCKRCGLDLFGLSEFVESGEGGSFIPPAWRTRKGIRQGVAFFALGLMLIPVWMFIAAIFPPNDKLVESAPSTTPLEMAAWIGMWMAFIAGAVRVIYSLVFENARMVRRSGVDGIGSPRSAKALPSADYFRPAQPENWKTTGDLFERVERNAKTSGDLT